ncbi:MAG: F0F1 ATP synthase subunit delta, partial [Patescibacteria group bacterium]
LLDTPQADVPAVLERFVAVVRRQRDGHKLRSMTNAYQRYADEQAGVVVAHVTMRSEPTPALRRSITAAVKELAVAGAVELDVTVDPTVIGGLRLQIGDTQWDSTIFARLQQLSQKIVS